MTGFYANRLAELSQNVTDPEFRYGRFKIHGPSKQCVAARQNGDHLPEASQQVPSTSPQYPRDTGDSPNSPFSSEEDMTSSPGGRSVELSPERRVPPPTGQQTTSSRRHSTRRPPQEEQYDKSGFQQMEQLVLPPVHPFCNFQEPNYTWPRAAMTFTPSSNCHDDPLFKLTANLKKVPRTGARNVDGHKTNVTESPKKDRSTSKRKRNKTTGVSKKRPIPCAVRTPAAAAPYAVCQSQTLVESSRIPCPSPAVTNSNNGQDSPLDLSCKPPTNTPSQNEKITYDYYSQQQKDTILQAPMNLVHPLAYHYSMAMMPFSYLSNYYGSLHRA